MGHARNQKALSDSSCNAHVKHKRFFHHRRRNLEKEGFLLLIQSEKAFHLFAIFYDFRDGRKVGLGCWGLFGGSFLSKCAPECQNHGGCETNTGFHKDAHWRPPQYLVDVVRTGYNTAKVVMYQMQPSGGSGNIPLSLPTC